MLQHGERGSDLFVRLAGECVSGDGHGPDHVFAFVGTTYALPCTSLEEPWILFAPDEASGAGVESLIGGAVNVWEREKTWDVGVVHQELAAVAVYLVSPDCALGSLCHGVLLESLGYFAR